MITQGEAFCLVLGMIMGLGLKVFYKALLKLEEN